jgi:hypothetical protein
MRHLKWKWEDQTCYRDDNRDCASAHPAPGELSIYFFKQIKKPPMKITGMLRISGGRKRWQKKGAVKTHKRAGLEEKLSRT